MKPWSILILTGVLMAAMPAAAQEALAPETANAIPRMAPTAVEFTLGNGMPVVVIPDHRAPVVTHMIWYRVGAADEAAGQSGIAHFLEHLMFKGTTNHPTGQFSERVAALGGEENAFTSSDYTAYFQRVAAKDLREMMQFESDRMANLVLTDEVVTPERNVVLEERRMRVESDPGSELSEALAATLYTNHPYGHPVIGWKHEIEALNRNTAIAFYNRYYTPTNAVLVIAGDVSPGEVRSIAEDTYGKIVSRPEAVRAPRPLEPPAVAQRTVTVRDEKVREPQLQTTYLVPSIATAKPGEAEALTVLAEVLGGGSTSRLYDQLVRGDGPATYAGAYYQANGVDDTRFLLYGIPKAGTDLRALEQRLDAVLEQIRDQGITPAELTRAKNSTIAQAIYSQDSQQTLARMVGTALMTGSTLADLQDWPARIQAVTAEDVRAVARKYFDPDRSVTGYLEPKVSRS